jgi:hypothetical protein
MPLGMPTELNLSISQTNLFYDKTKSFASRSQSEVDLAFSRLQFAIKKLNASGVLLTSTSTRLVRQAERHFGVSKWQVFSASRKFVFQHSRTDDLHIAVCPQPRIPQYQSDVESASKRVREYVEAVMQDYAKSSSIELAIRLPDESFLLRKSCVERVLSF